MTAFVGTTGDDSFKGSRSDDTFDLTQGGNDTASGQAGSDSFFLGGAFTNADSINGGLGFDRVFLEGDYSAGVSLLQSTLLNVEEIDLAPGFDYRLQFGNNIIKGSSLTVDGSTLGIHDRMHIDGSVEVDALVINAGAGQDNLKAGSGADQISGGGGPDRIFGGAGDDVITGGTGSDRMDGAIGFDRFVFNWGDSPLVKPDVIRDLEPHDVIDLSSIDVSPDPGHQGFQLVSSFSHTAGEMMLSYDAGTHRTSLLMDLDGDAAPDMTILMRGDQTLFTNFLV